MTFRKYTFLAVLALCVFSSAVNAADEAWHKGLDFMYGRSNYDVSNCTGDCSVVPTNPDNDWHIGLGFTAEKKFSSVGLGATVRMYDSNNDDSFGLFVDAFLRASFPIGQVVPYIGYGISRQDYNARLTTRDGPNFEDKLSSPLIVLGLEKRGDWGFWFAEISRTDDEVSVRSNRSSTTQIPVSATFDIERTTLFIGASINIK